MRVKTSKLGYARKLITELLSEKMAQVHFLFPDISTKKVDWEIIVDELSEPQTLHLTRSLETNILIAMEVGLKFSNHKVV